MSLNLDKSSWERIRFGDVVNHVNETVRDAAIASIDRVVGLDHLDPGSLEITRWGDDPSSTTFTKRVRPGQTLFGKRRAYQRKAAYADFEAITSGDILTFEAIPSRLDPKLLPFLVQSERFFANALETSAGSLSPRTNWGDLAKFEFSLPPLPEQQRLSDLLWAAEYHRRTLTQLRAADSSALGEYALCLFGQVADKTLVGRVASSRSGPSFAASDVSSSPIDGALPILGITNTKPDGSIDMSEVSYVSGLTKSVGTIDEGSLVLIRTNGNRQRIGNVYVPPIGAYGYAVSAFQFLMQPVDQEDRDYLYWVLRQPGMQKLMSENASGSTGLGNLAVGWLNQQQIPWPANRRERGEIVRLLDFASESLGTINIEIEATKTLTTSVLKEVFE